MSDDYSQSADQPTPMSRQDLEVRMITKAWRDPAYQAALLANPKATLESELKALDPSIALPDDLTVEVHPEDENNYHIVIPRNPAEIGTGGVSGDDMQAVSPQTIAIVVVGAVVAGGPQAVVGVNALLAMGTEVVSAVIAGPGGVVTSVATTVFDGPSPILGVTTATTIV